MSEQKTLDAVCPGEYIAAELIARGWTVDRFAAMIVRPTLYVEEILSGVRKIDEHAASEIGFAFGTSSEMWLNLQKSFDESPTAPTSD